MTDQSPLALVVTNDEPRILDLDLAERLGMKNPRKIRSDLILPNMDELKGLGGLEVSTPNSGPKGGRPAKVFYLNEEQALLIAMFSRTANAADVRREVISVFMAYRRGQLELSAKGRVELTKFR